MALQSSQIANLNSLNAKIAGGYTPTATDTANLNYAKNQGYKYTPLPAGSTPITSPIGLKGLNENQIYRSGTDIYKLPKTLSSDKITGSSNTITPVVNNQVNNVPSLMAGLDTSNKGIEAQLKYYNQTLPEKTTLNTKEQNAATYGESIKTANADTLKNTQNQYGLTENVNQLNQIMPQIASLKASYDNAIQAENGRAGLAGSIYGRQALETNAQATRLAGLSAVAQAYQGNVDMARNIANDAVNAQYKDEQNYINNLNTQITNSYNDLTTAEKKRADNILTINNERTRQIEAEKTEKNNINNVAIEAAKNGADTSTVNKILGSKTQADAIKNSGQYLKAPATASWDTFTDSNGNVKLVNKVTGQVKDASSTTTVLGNPVGEIKGLPSFDTFTNNPGVSRSNRNNNPGNIKVSDATKNWDGVIGVESKAAGDGGNFLIFDSPESGINAIGRLLQTTGYSGMTAEKAIKRYNGNGSYGAADVGLDPSKDFQSQIQDPNKLKEVANAIAVNEGFTGGTKTDTTSAASYAKLIQAGTMKIENVPEKMRTAVAQELAKLPNPKDTANDAAAKEKANLAVSLISNPGLNSAVGPIGLTRIAAPWNISNKQNFIAGVEQLISGLSLDALIQAKAQGATFGALSDAEMRILSSSASRIGSWTMRDKTGKVTGYKVDEKSFKDELNNINKILLRGITTNTENQNNTVSTPTAGTTPSGVTYTVTQ